MFAYKKYMRIAGMIIDRYCILPQSVIAYPCILEISFLALEFCESLRPFADGFKSWFAQNVNQWKEVQGPCQLPPPCPGGMYLCIKRRNPLGEIEAHPRPHI